MWNYIGQAMARDHVLLVILLVLLLSVILPSIQSDLTFVGKSQLFWVAADKIQCSHYSNDSNCDTLVGYLNRDDVNFSLSDTTWIFLHGEHAVNSSDCSLEIMGARNVKLKGEDECAIGDEECVFTMEQHGECEGADIFVWGSSHVTIELLKLKNTFIAVTETSNLLVHAVDFQRSALSIKNPIGDYTIMDSSFGPASHITTYLFSCPSTAAENCNFSFTLKQRMKWSPKLRFAQWNHINLFGMHMVGQHNYSSIKIFLTDSTFFDTALSILVSNYPLWLFTVEVNNVTFTGGTLILTMPLMENVTYPAGSINKWLGAQVLITGCNFVEAVGRIKLNFFGDSREGVAIMKYPEIVISHTTFEGNKIRPRYSSSSKLSIEISDNMRNPDETSLWTLLTIQNNTFKRALASDESNTFAALTLRNLRGCRVVMAGDNQIVSNWGYGLKLNNTQIEFHGYNEISKNRYEKDRFTAGNGGGIYMSSDSRLLLAPGTLLNVSENSGNPFGGGVFICYSGAKKTLTLNEFVDCYAEKLTCPGWCFFQFINSDGQYVN